MLSNCLGYSVIRPDAIVLTSTMELEPDSHSSATGLFSDSSLAAFRSFSRARNSRSSVSSNLEDFSFRVSTVRLSGLVLVGASLG